MGPLLAGLVGAIPNLIGSIGGAVQSVIDARQQRRNIDMQNAANKQLAEYQYSKQLEMWNRQNEYNSPSKQMERFNAAGLNPNLIYGQGNAGNATQLPRYEAPQLSYNYKAPINIGSVVQQYQDFKLRQAQIDNVSEVARQNRIKADLDQANYDLMIGQEKKVDMDGNVTIYAPNYMRKFFTQLQSIELGNRQKENVINEVLLKNLLLQKDLNWYTAQNLSNIISKGISTIGIGGLLRKGIKLNTPSGLAPYKGIVNYSPQLSRSITKYYR